MDRVKILIVDDESAMRAFVRAALKASFPDGVEIEEASSGETARDKAGGSALPHCDKRLEHARHERD